jgi:hypothetical protein
MLSVEPGARWCRPASPGRWAGPAAKAVSSDSFDRVTPQLFLGKGFGDLPDSLGFAKPLALTGVFGYSFPTRLRTQTIARCGREHAYYGHRASDVYLPSRPTYAIDTTTDRALRATPEEFLRPPEFFFRGSSGAWEVDRERRTLLA